LTLPGHCREILQRLADRLCRRIKRWLGLLIRVGIGPAYEQTLNGKGVQTAAFRALPDVWIRAEMGVVGLAAAGLPCDGLAERDWTMRRGDTSPRYTTRGDVPVAVA
jgi:hypothetical protein